MRLSVRWLRMGELLGGSMFTRADTLILGIGIMLGIVVYLLSPLASELRFWGAYATAILTVRGLGGILYGSK